MLGVLALTKKKEVHENKNKYSKVAVLLDYSTFRYNNCEKIKIIDNNKSDLVRLYRFKNTRIKKALVFSLNVNSSKLA